MLDEYRHICEEIANTIPDWKKLSKNELCRLCVANENNPVLYNAYFAAIQYRYWHLISKYYTSCNGLVEPEVCRDWLIDTIMYALKHRRWEDEDSTVFNDPTGPDKVINTKMKCLKINQYQYSNRKKRKDAFGMMSLDDLTEKTTDSNLGLFDESTELEIRELDIKSYIKKLFLKKDYFMAYMLDGIVSADVFELSDTGNVTFSLKKLSKFIRKITPTYCQQFAQRYEIDEDVVIKSLIYFHNLSIRKVNSKIEYNLHKLRYDPMIIELLGEGVSR